MNTHKELGQTSQQKKFKKKNLNTLNEHILEQLLCSIVREWRIFLYLMIHEMQRKYAWYDLSKLYSVLLKSCYWVTQV